MKPEAILVELITLFGDDFFEEISVEKDTPETGYPLKIKEADSKRRPPRYAIFLLITARKYCS